MEDIPREAESKESLEQWKLYIEQKPIQWTRSIGPRQYWQSDHEEELRDMGNKDIETYWKAFKAQQTNPFPKGKNT